jgi:hypothetical protein
MRTYASLMTGGVTTAHETIVPCRPESSLVWNKLTSDAPWVGARMPTTGVLSATLLAMLRTWILEGAPSDARDPCF